MRIILFTEIYDCGGIDTFIVNLINGWPDRTDSFIIVANSDYPGLSVIEERLARPCEVIRHKVLLYSNLPAGTSPWQLLGKVLSPVLRYLVLCCNILSFRKLFFQCRADRLMVINGGYPGGDSCRAAGISWGLFSGKPGSIHNFHNLAIRAPWYLRVQEYIVDTFLCLATSRFITVSNAAAQSMAARPGIWAKKMTSYIHNGISFPPKQPESVKNVREEIGIPRVAPLCLMLGTYEPRKGHRFLFKAFKKVLAEVPHTHLLVCGFGLPEEVSTVRQHVKELCLEGNVHLVGFRSDLSSLFSAADVLLISSQAYESFGFTSVEAMAHRIPVVATAVGGVPEVVQDGDGGYCVDPEDVAGYAARIIALLRDDKLRAEQGEKGFNRVQRLFTSKVMAEKYWEMLKAIK